MKKTNNVITEKVKNFYENNPCPGIERKLNLDSTRRLSSYFNKPGKILFPGCGTVLGIVAMAKITSRSEMLRS